MKNHPSFPKEAPEKFPVKTVRGSGFVIIYRVQDGDYSVFRIPYFEHGVRKFHRFTTYESARDKGNEMLDQLSTGQHSAITLKDADKHVYLRAVQDLKPFNVRLDAAVGQFTEASKILSSMGVSITEAARDYVRRNANMIRDKNMADAVTDFIAAKTAAGRSELYLADLNYRLGKLKSGFNCRVMDVTEEMLRKFLESIDLSPRSQNNFRGSLVTFFRWCVRKKYLPKDWDEFASIEVVEQSEGKIEIFTSEELAAILTHADAKIIPFLAIGAFAGMRCSEICRLDWKNVGISNWKYINVDASVARKKKQRRLVPISENLKCWLQPYAKGSGPVWPHSVAYVYEVLEKICANAETKWKDNALRHSYISYRMAEIQDAAKVSLEAGNSPQMVFNNYRELVTPEESARWFSIKPDESADGKVIWLKAA